MRCGVAQGFLLLSPRPLRDAPGPTLKKIYCLNYPVYRLRLTVTCYCLFVSDDLTAREKQSQNAPNVETCIARAPGPRASVSSGPDRLVMDDPETDRIIVERVYRNCQRYIVSAVSRSSLPAEFLGALTGNESGGSADARCFEARVYADLQAVASGRIPAYGSIGRTQLSSALKQAMIFLERGVEGTELTQGIREDTSEEAIEPEDRGLRDFSTSWGFTQIMGYHLIGRKERIRALLDPQFHFPLAVELLSEFARRFRLRLSSDFDLLFRCWNTGRPDGATYDPAYVLMGMRRMLLYHRTMKQMPGSQ
ncbi:MAG: hypothetical protein ACRD06_01940 [Terriglobia bacterium]